MANVLILGASYGSLFAIKLLMAGNRVTLVCTAPTAELINREGIVVKFPIRGREGLVSVASRELPGALQSGDASGSSSALRAAPPEAVDVAGSGFDLAVLGMQEPQYSEPSMRALMAALAAARVPCLAIMNMPPLAYLKRLPGADAGAPALRACFAGGGAVWDAFDPSLVSLASPDPQAFRPPDAPKNVLQVGLPTNFKAAAFARPEHTALLRRLEAGVDAARLRLRQGEGAGADAEAEEIEVPVKLRVFDSLFVPLAKWPMLLTGNYRCARPGGGAVPIERAVHGDIELSRAVYEWVCGVCMRLGAARADLVPFEKYAAAAESLLKPSSVARALASGSTAVERVDALVLALAAQLGMADGDSGGDDGGGGGGGGAAATVRETVATVDAQLAANAAAAVAAGGGQQ